MFCIFLSIIILITDWKELEKRDFEKEGLNHPPDSFSFVPTHNQPKEWQVVQDGDNRVLSRRHANDKEGEVSLAVTEKAKLLDVFVSARIKALDGKGDKNGGLIWRYKDSKNYLLARLDIADKRVRLYRVVNGNRVKFGEESNLRVAAGMWYTLRVEHRSDKIKVYLDDEALIIEKDTHFRKAGRVGLYANEDSESYFDDFEVRSTGEKK